MSVGEHRLPLAPRWLASSLPPVRAGAPATAALTLENAGAATWRSRGSEGVQLSCHWLDPLGNPVVWDGPRTPLPRPVSPGETVVVKAAIVAPRPPGLYRLAFDLVEEHRFWFAELGCEPLDLEVEVLPRIAERSLRAVVHGGEHAHTTAALSAQEEPLATGEAAAVAHLVAGAVPAPDWSRRLLDAHAEGWAAVGPAVEGRGLDAWRPGGGRNPRFPAPLLLPSLLEGVEPGEHEGLPAYRGPDGVFDGRIVVRLRPRSGRRRS